MFHFSLIFLQLNEYSNGSLYTIDFYPRKLRGSIFWDGAEFCGGLRNDPSSLIPVPVPALKAHFIYSDIQTAADSFRTKIFKLLLQKPRMFDSVKFLADVQSR